MPTCQHQLQNGNQCRRIIADGERYCWQHAHGFRAKYRSITRSHPVAFWLSVASVTIGILGIILALATPTGFMQLEGMEVQSPGFVSGKPVHIVVRMVNRGAAPVFRFRLFAAICVIANAQGSDAELVKMAKERFGPALQKAQHESELAHQEGTEVGVNIGASRDLYYSLTDEELKGLNTGKTRLYALTWGRWEKHRAWKLWPEETTSCVMLRPFNEVGNDIVWANCS